MEKQVLITVDSILQNGSGDSDKMSFITDGKLVSENGQYTVSYEESEITGLNGTTTTLKVDNNSVTLIRQGNVEAIMLFEVGKTHLTDYDTQYGSVMLGITAKKVAVELGDSGGQINVDYILEYNRVYGGRNRLNVMVSERKNELTKARRME